MSSKLRAAALTLAAFFIAGHAAAQTPSADELVAKNLAARGGEAKLKSLNSMKLTGNVSAQGMDMPLTVLTKRPNKMRQEMTMQGQKVVQAFDGETVWGVNPMMGSTAPRVIEGPTADALKTRSIFDGPLVGYKDRGDTLEVVGPADVEGVKTWKLKLTRKDGQVHAHLPRRRDRSRQAVDGHDGAKRHDDGDQHGDDGVSAHRGDHGRAEHALDDGRPAGGGGQDRHR